MANNDFIKCETKDEILRVINAAIEEIDRTAMPQSDPHLEEIEAFLRCDDKSLINLPYFNAGISDRMKIISDPAAAAAKKFFIVDCWDLAFYYIYALWLGNSDETEESAINDKYNEIKTVIGSLREEFDKFPYYDYIRHISVLFLLGNASYISGWDVPSLEQQEVDKILNFLKNNNLSQTEIDEFLDAYSERIIPVIEIANFKEGEDIVRSKYQRNSMARVLERFKYSRNLKVLLDLIAGFKSEDKSYIPALGMKTEMLLANGFLDTINNKDQRLTKLTPHQKAVLFMSFFADKHQSKNLREGWQALEYYCHGTRKKVEEAKRDAAKTSARYKNVYDLIAGISDDTFITDNLAQRMFKDTAYAEEMQAVVYWIFFHNNRLYKKELEKNKKLVQDEERKKIALLKETKIPISKDVLEKIKSINVDELDKILKLLKKDYSPEEIAYILLISSPETIEKISSYVKNGFIELDYVKKHMSLFDITSISLKAYDEFLDFIKSYRLNPRLFVKSLELIMSDFPTFKNNVITISKYGLLQALRKFEGCFDFILDPDIERKIDKIIESGSFDYLLKDISMLSVPAERLNRLDVLIGMNIPISPEESAGACFIGNILSENFFAPDNELDNYLVKPDILEKDKEMAISLEDISRYRHRSNQKVLIIGDSYFSYNKIARLMNSGYSFVEALFSDRCATQEMYEDIMEEVRPLVKQKYES